MFINFINRFFFLPLSLSFLFCRANSIQNVSYNTSISPVTRRSSERELTEGSKKRATSASGLDRQSEGKIKIFSHFFATLYLISCSVNGAGI
jgi:hypothetical protein